MLTYSLCTGLGKDTYTIISNMQKVTAISTSFLLAQYPNNFLFSSLWVSEVKRQWREPFPLRTASSLPFFFRKAWFTWNSLLEGLLVVTLAGKKGSRTCFRMMTGLGVTKRCGVPRTNTCTQEPGNTAPSPRNMNWEMILEAHPKPQLSQNTTAAEGCSSPAWEPNAKRKSKYLMPKSSQELKSVLYLFLYISVVLGC